MKIPRLSKIFVICHGILALLIFIHVWASAGGYQNGLQWALVGFFDYPVFFPLRYLPEEQSMFNPALIPEMTLNFLTLAYALLFGTAYWFGLGWAITWIWQKVSQKSKSV